MSFIATIMSRTCRHSDGLPEVRQARPYMSWVCCFSNFRNTRQDKVDEEPTLQSASAYVRWPMHGNLDVTLMVVFVGGLRQNFDKTLTTLRQNFDKTLLMRTQNYLKHPLGAAKRPPRGILLSLGSHQQSFVEVLSKFCQSFVEDRHKDQH